MPRGRKSAEKFKVFHEQSLDQISAQNRTAQHESMANQLASEISHLSVESTPVAPKLPRASDLRKKFQSRSIDDIAKEHRRSLHQSMLGAEIIRKDFNNAETNVPDHLELHESQRAVRSMPRERAKNKVYIELDIRRGVDKKCVSNSVFEY